MTAFFAFLQTPAGQIFTLAVGYGLREGIAFLLKQRRASALAGVAQAAADAVNAGLAAKNQQTAVTAAKAALLADMPNVEKSVEASVDVLLAGHVAQLATAPGGSTVALPKLV